jgi:hypothetical protein
VYLDDARLGGVEQLRWIPATTVREMRFLSAIEATTRYGVGHSGGAVVVMSRTGS